MREGNESEKEKEKERGRGRWRKEERETYREFTFNRLIQNHIGIHRNSMCSAGLLCVFLIRDSGVNTVVLFI